jgi:exodeoxyribonuclease V gamma subunit
LNHKIKNPFKPIYNKPLEWLCRSNELDGSGIHTHWKEKGENLFAKLLQNWTVKK